MRRCQRYFERYLLPEINAPLVLGLDEVDQVFEHAEIATDFFGDAARLARRGLNR